MQIVIAKDYHEMSQKAVDIVVNQINAKPDSNLALPTGDTPLMFYRGLVKAYKNGEVDFSKVHTFNLDEYIGLTHTNRGSYAFYMYINLFSHVNLAYNAAHLPDGMSKNLKSECEKYEKAISDAGGIDLAVLGIGANGHIGFNEPGTAFDTTTHIANLTEETKTDNLHHFGDYSRVPKKAVTVGLKTITGSKKIVLMASGPRKAKAISEFVNGPVSKDLPASILQTHDDVTLIIDEAAAGELKSSGYTDQNLCEFTIYSEHALPRGKTIAVISPHPDDSCISAGGTLAMLAPNNDVRVLVMSSGHTASIPRLTKAQKIKRRQNEAMEESIVLGTKCKCLNLGFYDSKEITKKDVDEVYKNLRELDPEIVFLTKLDDHHPTHKMSAEIAMKAIKRLVEDKKHIIELWHYETPWSLFTPGNFNAVVQLPKSIVSKKIKAVRRHKSQIQRTPFDKVSKAMAIMRGAIVPEQVLGVYGQEPPKLEEHAEVYSINRITYGQKLVESFSGIRGIYGIDLNDEIAEGYAYAYGTWLKHETGVNPKVVIGRDTRPSGKRLAEAMTRGLERAHCHIFQIGVATTPLVQFEVRNRRSHGGIIVTASHNEPDWNGFKFLWNDGGVLNPAQMEELIEKYNLEKEESERAISEHYVQYVMKALGKTVIGKIKRAKLKVVVDPNGGAMIVLIKKLFDKLGVKTVEINMDPGVFKHKVEPTIEALKHMGPIVNKYKANLGVAWDCDGDRVEIVLPNGDLISGHYVLALLVDEVLSGKVKNRIVVVNDATSNVVAKIAKRHNAKVVETDVGEPNVVKMMYKLDAPVGGEGACGGGIIPPSRCRDGVLTLFKILGLMVTRKASLEEILAGYPIYSTKLKNIKLYKGGLEKLRKNVERHYKKFKIQKRGGKNGSLKIHLSNNSYVLFRPSRTEPDILRIIADSPSAEDTKRIMNEAVNLIG